MSLPKYYPLLLHGHRASLAKLTADEAVVEHAEGFSASGGDEVVPLEDGLELRLEELLAVAVSLLVVELDGALVGLSLRDYGV